MQQNANSNPPVPFILSLDVGTSSTRALLFDATGTGVPGIQVQDSYELTVSGEGEVSVDADKLVAVVATTIDKALKSAGSLASSIGAVAVDTFWHSLVGVDKDGHPVIPVITWEDTRPRQAAAELSKKLDKEPFTSGRAPYFMRATGLPSCAGWRRLSQKLLRARLSGSPLANTCIDSFWDVQSVASRWPPGQACW